MNFLARILFLFVLVCSFPGQGPARAQGCESPVALLDRAIEDPRIAAQIVRVDRLDRKNQVEVYLATVGAPLGKGEDSLIIVLMGDEAIVFLIKERCVLSTGKLSAGDHQRALYVALGSPA
jgi:hypothetical protein